MKNYVGSIAISRDGGMFATSSPRGGVVLYWDGETGRHISTAKLADGCGIAPEKDGFLLSNGHGVLAYSETQNFSDLRKVTTTKLRWDNHMHSLRG